MFPGTEAPKGEEAILAAALELPPEERAACLDRACRDDAALRRRVEALLNAHAAGGFLEAPARLVAGRSPDSSPPLSERPGDCIGRYKLLQQIGEGGCGVVYMAEQKEPVRRRVALKVIKLGMDTKQVIARFEAERQALALMDHPNIAKVLDAGATETGRPYFVMELVRGVKITDYCDEDKVPTNDRLKLFIQVCQAIQHAHQKGVIHRDIKPSNILVTINDGVAVPKVIDFGIAKATTGQPLTDKTLFTAFEQFIGTPAYMSPEQAVLTSLDIDTRSDIYSLGVLLYELLTGSTPFDQKELLAAGLDEMRRTIREKEPPRPSTRLSTMAADALTTTAEHRHTDATKLVHLLRGDLDWIAMKCLEKERQRRYETANGLARDVERHLNHEPVVARPPSTLYRFQSLARRNRLAFVAASAVIAALAIGLGFSTWMLVREKQAHREAEAARANEALQRQKAEARERIAQAKLLLDAGKYDEAEQLLNQIPPALVEPSSLHADARRVLGWWRALHEQWKEAAASFAILRQVDGLDGSDITTTDDCMYSAALAELGDKTGCEKLWQEMVSRFPKEDFRVGAGWQFAERVLRLMFVRPSDAKSTATVDMLYDVLLQGQGAPDLPQVSKPWGRLALALVDYRRGNYQKSVESCQQYLASTSAKTVLTSMNESILAMNYQKQDRPVEARAALAKSREACETGFRVSDSSWGLGIYVQKIPLFNGINCVILLREATALIEGGPKGDEKGYAPAQNGLGLMYARGNGVTKDAVQAASWFRKAADQGHASAQNDLGVAYVRGDGVAKDLTEAAKWFGKAAEQGNVLAQVNLGRKYELGQGVAKDAAEAAMWYRKAADKGNTSAQFSLGQMCARGEGVPKDETEAAKWYRKAANKGNISAQFSLGQMYARGEGVPKDETEAANWYRKVAESGNLAGLNELAWLLATCPDPKIRDGPSAVTYALQAVTGTARTNASYLDTLAAAYAEAADFPKAVTVQKEAVALNDSDNEKEDYASRLRLYESNKPHRDP